ncbi:MAG: glycosyltransferase family 39 protein, partial [Chloroflexi bacterium]|nr:glycosyltransferase family 39 protein [Chloroflexota bacterium]
MHKRLTRLESGVLGRVWGGYKWEIALVAGLVIAALAVRLPELLLIPRYTDEWAEVFWALDIALGKHLPLTGVDPYDGPFFAYLIAGLFRVFGIGLAVPRLAICVFGSLTVAATYVLGRLMAGRLAGFIAAGLTLTCPLLVVFSSHHGWSSALTPFFATASTALVYAGVIWSRKLLVMLGALCAGLMLQTHPTSGVALIGIAVWFVLESGPRRAWRQAATYFGVAGFIVGYAPMLAVLLRPDNAVFATAQQRTYAFVPATGLADYISRLIVMLRIGGFYVGGGIGDGSLVLRLTAIAAELLLAIALVAAWRARNRLVLFILASTLLVLPTVIAGDSYRYYDYVIPLLFALLGVLAANLLRWLGTPGLVLAGRPWFARVAKVAVAVFVAAAILFPLVTIHAYYRDTTAAGITNAGYYSIADDVQAQGACGPRLFMEDEQPRSVAPEQVPVAIALNAMHYVLTLDGCEHTMLDKPALAGRLAETGGWLIAMTNRRLDLGLATAFFGAALALRLPELMMVPRYSDEGFEVLWALDIATGRRLPLTSGVNNYYGPLFAYALAGLFKVFGTNIVLPRLTAAVLGALTTAVTYEFARLAWSRSAGIAAATLTAICPALILFAGHLGWSSSWTPFFVTAALTSLYAGVSGGRRFWLAASGMLAAAAIQTHPTSAVILVGIVLWLVALSRRQRLDWLGLAFAGGLVVLGCAPIFVIFAQAHAADAPLSTGIFAPTISLGEYGARLVSFVRIAGFFLAGAIGDATPVARAQAIVVEALAVASLFVCWKRGVTFVPLVVVAGVLALPLFVAEFDQRYYQFLFPAAYVALGILAAQALAALRGALRAVPALTVLVLSLLSVYAPIFVIF